jgi:hypothetical protein
MTANLTAEISEKGFIGKMVSLTADNEYVTETTKMLSLVSASIETLSNDVRYKASQFIEAADIEQIKATLKKYTNNNEKVKSFKKMLIEDLTNFEQQIKVNHVQKIEALRKEKQFLERQLKVLDFAKHKLIMDRLSRIEWPYDAKTKEFDTKISALEFKIKRLGEKIEEANKFRPLAREKEILMYQIKLKEKYSVK